MPLRDLLCVLEAAEKPMKNALELGAALARGYAAHATVAIAAPKVAQPSTLIDIPSVTGLAAAENERVRARAARLADEARKALPRGKGEVAICADAFHAMVADIKARAMCHDLTVLDRPGGFVDRSEVLFEEMLFAAGRPVLVAVPGQAPVKKFSRIAVAWDGSSHAARALTLALSLFAGLREAEVVTVAGEKDLSGTVPPAQIAAHIVRHGVKAKVAELKVGNKSVAAAIDAHAKKAGADLIVMGGFGRSRLREFVLGGVTRELSQTARTPLLLVH